MRKKHLKLDYNDLLQGKMTDQRAVSMLYDRYRSEFMAFVCKKFTLDQNSAIELYQECFVALYENVHSGKLTELTCSLKTYIFRIATNKMLNRLRDLKPHIELTDDQFIEQDETWNIQQQIVYDVVQKMDEPCSRVLKLYYWDRLSMEEIALQMNYVGAQVAKNRKLSCMRKLKLALMSKFVADEIL